MRIHKSYAPFLFISPFFVLFAIFNVFPTFYGLLLAFTKTRLTDLGNMPWNGLENFEFTLFKDPTFWKALGNTLILGVYGMLIQPIALLLAFAIQMSLKRFRGVLLAIYFMPFITSAVAVGLVFSLVFSERIGVINTTLVFLNSLPVVGFLFPSQGIAWMRDPATVQPVIALFVLWKFLGYNTILYLARLQSIPAELYEAAKVDGANSSDLLWRVVVPQVMGVLFLNISLTIIGQMQLFDEPFTLAGKDGGAGQMGLTVAMYLYKTMTEFKEAGTASAMGWILFIFILSMTFINNKIFGAAGRGRGE